MKMRELKGLSFSHDRPTSPANALAWAHVTCFAHDWQAVNRLFRGWLFVG